ncbi:uncharacterized protein IUM83_14926 [Phytophthora cinnamomi]|uniref:uncharacterized protein n=1 Tax=Phytophthora cinnamomi TaxID=4785 RepID=UPI00355A904F|nr:hypothetical protein IUM83_14926 [Phytophthora cinnamomi]
MVLQDESTDNHALGDDSSLDLTLAQSTPSQLAPATQITTPATATSALADTVTLGSSAAPATAPAGTANTASNGEAAQADRRTQRRRTTPRASRGSGFTRVEVDGLLDLLESMKPIGRDEWETVARRHNANHPGVDRTVESLRRKFAKLYRTNMGTGNPHMPDDVARAIQISTAITQRADLARGDDISEDGAELFEEEESAREDEDARAATTAVPAARPLVLPRVPTERGDDDLLSMARLMMIQEQRQREADRDQQQRWREEDQHQREQDRAEDRERSNRLFELLAMALVGVAKTIQTHEQSN